MKKTARIVCTSDKEFWTTQKQFWMWVREGFVDVTGQRPLTGRFAGRREKLVAMARSIRLAAENSSITLLDENPPQKNNIQIPQQIPSTIESRKGPPQFAEYLLYLLLSKPERENLIGDLIEEYNPIQSKFGTRKANIWFYKQVFSSFWPLFRRLVIKWGFIAWLGQLARKLIS